LGGGVAPASGGGGLNAPGMPPPWWRLARPGRFFQVIVVGMDRLLPPPGPQCPFDPARALAAAGDLERVAALVGGGCTVRLRGGGSAASGPPGSGQGEPLQVVVGAEAEAAVARAVRELKGCLEQCWRAAKQAAGPRALPPDAPLPCATPAAASSAQGGADGGPLHMAGVPGDLAPDDPQAKRLRVF
jgi:hypothetical protein